VKENPGHPICCRRCGKSTGTLRRVRGADGKKLIPAAYEHPGGCIIDTPVVLPKEELLALRRPAV